MKDKETIRIAEMLRRIANKPAASEIKVKLPSNPMGLPSGEFWLGSFLTHIANNLKREK